MSEPDAKRPRTADEESTDCGSDYEEGVDGATEVADDEEQGNDSATDIAEDEEQNTGNDSATDVAEDDEIVEIPHKNPKESTAHLMIDAIILQEGQVVEFVTKHGNVRNVKPYSFVQGSKVLLEETDWEAAFVLLLENSASATYQTIADKIIIECTGVCGARPVTFRFNRSA